MSWTECPPKMQDEYRADAAFVLEVPYSYPHLTENMGWRDRV